MSAWQVVVYNPLVHVRSSPVRLPISTPAYTVYFGTPSLLTPHSSHAMRAVVHTHSRLIPHSSLLTCNASCCLHPSVSAARVVSGEEEVPCDVITTEASPDSNAAPYTLVFQATHVPPVGIKTYAYLISLPPQSHVCVS